MLKKIHRLSGNKLFREILKKGYLIRSQHLFFKFEKASEGKKIAFIVSKKVSKKAVVRNKIRRRLREIIRSEISGLKEGFRGIFVAIPGIEKLSFQELRKEVGSIIQKLKK